MIVSGNQQGVHKASEISLFTTKNSLTNVW